MSTYLPGVTDYIPQIQPFKPDFNFYAGALQMKQTQYDTAHKQLSNLYGSLLNAPMLRETNLQAREDYFKAIDGEIKKVSNLDLSQQQNVDSATALFSGLYENKNIVKDMVWTKNYQSQVERGEGFRNCLDPAKCGGSYWDGGMKALSYKAEEFRNATDEQALGFGNARYTPYQNVMEKAIKIAKEADLNITLDSINGGYIVTTKNGPSLVQPLNSLFTGVLGSDPSVMDYYNTKAYVDRKDWVQGNVPVYGSQEAAEMAYMDKVSTGLEQMLSGAKKEIDTKVGNVEGQKKQLEERIRTEGATPNGMLAEQYRILNGLGETMKGSQASIDVANKTYANSVDPAMRAYMGENLDKAMASYLLASDIGNAAQTLAYKDYEQTIEADPYALEQVRHSNRMLLEKTRAGNNKILQDEKLNAEKAEALALVKGGHESNIPRLTKVAKGASEADLDPEAMYKQFKEERGDIVTDLSANEKSLLQDIMIRTAQKSKLENGSGLASQDLLDFGDAFFNALTNDANATYSPTKEDYITQAQNSRYYANEKAKWEKMNSAEKIAYAQKKDFSKIINHDQISGTVLDQIYDEVVSPVVNYDNPSNRINKDYLQDIWETSQGKRNDIATKKALLTDIGEWYGAETSNIISTMAADPEFKGYTPMMNLLFDPETGTKRSSVEFARDYAKLDMETNGSSYEEAYMIGLGLYTGDIHLRHKEHGLNVFGKVHTGNTNPLEYVKNEPIQGLLFTDLNPQGRGNSWTLDQVWAQAFSKWAKPKGQGIALGLLGGGSTATMRLDFDHVDPAEYASEGTMNTISFMNNAMSDGDEGNVLYAFGAPGSVLPEESIEKLRNFLPQLYGDMLHKKDFKDKTRPVISVGYQGIAGSDGDWSALHIKIPYEYQKDFVGTEDNPGPLWGQADNLIDGFTVYMNDQIANNGFYEATKSTDVEKAMHYTGKYDFDAYPDFVKDGMLKMNAQGNYDFTAKLLEYNSEGIEEWTPYGFTYTQLGTDLNLAVENINGFLENRIYSPENGMLLTKSYWDSQNSTKDPNALLNQ